MMLRLLHSKKKTYLRVICCNFNTVAQFFFALREQKVCRDKI